MNTKKLLDKKNVWAIGEGYKVSRSPIKKISNFLKRKRRETCIRFYVENKEKIGNLKKKDIIPKEIDGKETDVIQSTPVKHLSEYRRMHRPIKAGVSMCNAYSTACDSGGPVYKEGKVFDLVNNHCQTRMGMAHTDTKKGDPILQPSLFDGGRLETHKSGEVYEWYPRTVGKINEMDAGLNIAIAGIKRERRTVRTEYIPEVGEDVKPGDIVWKEGRTTGYTKAKVLDVNVIVRVNSEEGVLTYGGMTFTEPKLGDGGDSSSWVFNKTNRVVEQLFAGSADIICTQPIKKPLKYFKVSLTPEEPTKKYIALGNWLNFKGTEITTKYWPNRARLRSEPKIEDNIIKTLPGGTKLEIKKLVGVSDDFYWMEVT